jgi:hypothetical protein
MALLALASLAASAGPSQSPALTQARIFLEQGRYDEATTQLSAEYRRAPGPEVLRLLALARYQVGDTEQAAPLLERAVAAYPGDVGLRRAAARVALDLELPGQARPHIDYLLRHAPDAQAHLLDGDAQAAAGDDSAAMGAYERALRQTGGAMQQRLALRLIPLYRAAGRAAEADAVGEAAIAADPKSFDGAFLRLLLDAAPPVEPYELKAYLHYRLEHDDNVQLLADAPGIGDGADKSDTRHVLMADLLGRYGLGGGWDLFGEFHLYSGFHQELDHYDQTALNLVLGPGWSGESFGLRLPLEFTRNNLDGERLSETFSAAPGLWFRWGEGTLLRGFVRYASDDYAEPRRAGEDRDGDRLGGGLVFYHPFDADGSHLRLLAEHYEDDADGSNWDRSVNRFLATADLRIAADFSLGGSYQYEDYDYDNLHDLFLQARQDEVNTFSAWLGWRFHPHWEARLQATYTDWDSNLAAYAYERTVVSAGVSWHY